MTIEEVRQLFTENNNKSRLDIDLINAECITSKNNNFSLDDQGNLTVNSLTTRTGNINDNISEIILNLVYPVGSIYIGVNSSNPSTFIGGSWEQIQDRFLLACGNTYSNGSIGGEASHTLTIAEMPTHTHMPTNNQNYFTMQSWGGGKNPYESGAGSWTGFASQYTGATGGSQSHNNMPPYLAVYVWKRIA